MKLSLFRPLRSNSAGVLLVLVLAAGCGGSGKINIHGKVTLDGQPVANGAIRFTTTDGKGQPVGGVIKDGEYEAEVPPGSYKVEINSSKAVAKRKGEGPGGERFEECIPSQYNSASKLTVQVKSDKREYDFPLKTKE